MFRTIKNLKHTNILLSQYEQLRSGQSSRVAPIDQEDLRIDNKILIKDPLPLEEVLMKAEGLINDMKVEHSKQRLEEAYRKMKTFEELEAVWPEENKEEYQRIFKENQVQFETIKDEHKYLNEIIEELDKDEGWNVEKDGAYRILYKKVPNSPMISIRMEAEVDVPLVNMITLINEIELWSLWVPFIKSTREVKAIHKGAKIYHAEYGLPYPLANRELYVYGTGVTRFYENGTVMILAKSVHNDKELFERHNIEKIKDNGDIMMELTLGGMEMKPIGPEKTKFKGIANVNPNLSWMPDSVLNFVVRKGAGFIFNKIINQARNFKGSAWERETLKEDKKEFYEWLQGNINEYFERQRAQEVQEVSLG